MRRASSLLVFLVALLAPLIVVTGPSTGAQETFTAAASKAGPGNREPVNLTEARRYVLRYVNNYRRAHKLAPMRAHACLDRRAAHPWAVHMARTGNFAHQDLDGVFAKCPMFRRLGENIAYGQRTPRQVVIAWMRSPGHRANILKPQHRWLGVGYARDGEGRPYWVQNFGGVR